MSDLSDLYQEIVLDHSKRPRNQRENEHADRTAEGFNPLCGDRVKVYLNLNDHTIEDVSFTGTGCAICIASCSLMTQQLQGMNEDDARDVFNTFHKLLTERDETNIDEDQLGELAALAGVKRYPIRVKCATLPWHALKTALEGEQQVASTE